MLTTILIAGLAAVFALPFGLLPSIVLFRALADGTDQTAATKKAYAATVWGGLAAVPLAVAGIVVAMLA